MSYILRPYPDVIKEAIGRIVKEERIKSNGCYKEYYNKYAAGRRSVDKKEGS